MGIHAFAALEAGQPLQAFEYEPEKLGDHDVDVDIEHCGICHSDISMIKNEWGMSHYPLIPGHEAVGKVTACGSQVSLVKPGDYVGVGWQSDSCGQCEWCAGGNENVCFTHNEGTIVDRFGGFAEAVRVNERFAIPIPSDFDIKRVGPLLCGGVTSYSPLITHNIQSGMTVGIIGIGGLGHLGVKFARALGCEVTAFTSSDKKTEEAKSFGAHHVVSSTAPKALENLTNQYDFILNTANADLDWQAYLKALRPHGTLCFVGLPNSAISVDSDLLLDGEKKIAASAIGSPQRIRDMLEFAHQHDVLPVTEHFQFSDINQAIDHANTAPRFRVVLDMI
ncbi:MAG: NAD(P)-dependent alcohol dehydrogenase [Gammaproteobacteria bacterium]|nr:NAD(P)-dependent alcohol dehydrogenase [Gammaproteobacteria bacterium]